jgi:hypothetical protein
MSFFREFSCSVRSCEVFGAMKMDVVDGWTGLRPFAVCMWYGSRFWHYLIFYAAAV